VSGPVVKACNALFPDARPSARYLRKHPVVLPLVVAALRRLYHGLWVGGALSVLKDRLRFVPDEANAAAHEGDLAFDIPLADVTLVAWRSAFVTSIIDVDHRSGRSSFRCHGSKAFADVIREAVRHAGGRLEPPAASNPIS
jgi:hypothetical protein